jgi:hypothetical protein
MNIGFSAEVAERVGPVRAVGRVGRCFGDGPALREITIGVLQEVLGKCSHVRIPIGGEYGKRGPSWRSDFSKGEERERGLRAAGRVGGILSEGRDRSSRLFPERPKCSSCVAWPLCFWVADSNSVAPCPETRLFYNLRWSLAHPFKVERNAVGPDSACGFFRFGGDVLSKTSGGSVYVSNDFAELLAVVGGLGWEGTLKQGERGGKQGKSQGSDGELSAAHGEVSIACAVLGRKGEGTCG